MRYTIRPLGAWTEPETWPRAGSQRFKASWSSTLDLLGRALEYLDARNVVLQVDVTEGDIRLDGMLRANAKVGFWGVRVAFESKYGPLVYATDAYEQEYSYAMPGWQANIRAIALGLQALRAVDRYGVTRRGEQYKGWKQLTAGDGSPTTLEEARALVDSYGGLREALRATHPDHGGDSGEFHRVMAARGLIETGGA